MKILLDHNLDRRLKACLSAYETATAQEMGWADVVNGELLSRVVGNEFSVLLTADTNIKGQQNLSEHQISVVILRAYDNRLATHLDGGRRSFRTAKCSNR